MFYAYYWYRGNMNDAVDYEEPAIFVFDIDTNGMISLRDDYSGTYSIYEKGAVSDKTIYLDGHGTAVIYEDGDEIDRGEYRTVGEEFLFVSSSEDGTNFRFSLAMYTYNDIMLFVCYDVEEEYVYIGSDWSVLALYSFGHSEEYSAIHIDHYGIVTEGTYSFLSEHIVRFVTSGGAFEYYSVNGNSFTVYEDDFVVDGEHLVAYQGPMHVRELHIPVGVKVIDPYVFGYGFSLMLTQDEYDAGLTVEFDLNEVERIEHHAFYNVSNFSVGKIASATLVYIGDYAFYSGGHQYDTSQPSVFNSVRELDLPNVTYVGDYAFAGCNQFSVTEGTAKFGSLEYLGDHAFLMNKPTPSAVMTLDLTEVDLAHLVLHPTAIVRGPASLYDEGLPVRILVNGAEGMALTSGWTDEQRACVVPEGLSMTDAMAGKGFVGFGDSNVYLEFGVSYSVPGFFGVTYYHESDYGSWVAEETFFVYTCSEEDDRTKITVYKPDGVGGYAKQFEFYTDEKTVEIEDQLYYMSGVEQTVTLGNEKELTFTLGADVTSGYLGTEVEITLSDVTYGDKEGTSPVVSGYGLVFEYTVTEENGDVTTYTVTADPTDWTVSEEVSGLTLTKEFDGVTYRATFGGYLSGKPRTLSKFEKKTGDDFETVKTFAERDQTKESIEFPFTVSGTNSVDTYLVTFVPAQDGVAATFTVTVSSATTVVKDIDGYKVTYSYSASEPNKVVDILRLQVLSGNYDDFNWIYNSGLFNVTKERVSDTSFTITKSGSTVTVYTVTVTPPCSDSAEVSVTVSSRTTKTIQTAHDEHEDYYEVTIVVDDEGNFYGLSIGSDVVSYSDWNEYFDYSRFTVTFVPDPSSESYKESKNGDNVYVYELFSSWKVTITVSDAGSEKQYTLTVESI